MQIRRLFIRNENADAGRREYANQSTSLSHFLGESGSNCYDRRMPKRTLSRCATLLRPMSGSRLVAAHGMISWMQDEIGFVSISRLLNLGSPLTLKVQHSIDNPEMAEPFRLMHKALEVEPGHRVQMLSRLGCAAQSPPSPRWAVETRILTI
jgi:hypothetical protein